MSALSELEGVVLGILQAKEPCTAYGIRKALRDSPSSFWSGSAGAIYPLLQRLEGAGAIESVVDPDDRRGRRFLRLTSSGRSAHLDWMLGASSTAVASAVSDTVRSRAFFLGSLTAKDQESFVNDSLAALEAFLESTRTDLEARKVSGDPYSYLASLGGVYQAEARVKWMQELRTVLAEQRPLGAE